MPTIKVDLDTKSFRRLTAIAVKERRSIPWQAEIILLQALATPIDGTASRKDTHIEQQVREEVSCNVGDSHV
jgi:hypothetical protein